jgi:hypothetical protein
MPGFLEGWETFKRVAGPRLVEEVAAMSPVGDPLNDPAPGTLQQSHSARSGDGGRLEIISTDPRGPIAAYVIRGTAPHGIDPVNAPLLHWIGPDGDVFARHVDHPGTRPVPYPEYAWENVRGEMVALFRATVGPAVLSILNPWKNKVIK